MATYFHGTTKENYENMLKGNCKDNPTWNCSDDNEIYLWDAEKNLENSDDVKEYCINQAFESAQLTAAIKGKDTDLIVIELEIPSNLIEDDYSCDNMSDVASLISFDDFSTDFIKSTFKCSYSAYLSPFVLSGVIGREQFNDCNIEYDLITLAKDLHGKDIFLETMYEFDYEKIAV